MRPSSRAATCALIGFEVCSAAVEILEHQSDQNSLKWPKMSSVRTCKRSLFFPNICECQDTV